MKQRVALRNDTFAQLQRARANSLPKRRRSRSQLLDSGIFSLFFSCFIIGVINDNVGDQDEERRMEEEQDRADSQASEREGEMPVDNFVEVMVDEENNREPELPEGKLTLLYHLFFDCD